VQGLHRQTIYFAPAITSATDIHQKYCKSLSPLDLNLSDTESQNALPGGSQAGPLANVEFASVVLFGSVSDNFDVL
jgi:hypothetical protein